VVCLAAAAPAHAQTAPETVIVEADNPDATAPMATSSSVTVIEVDERLPASSDVASVVASAPGTTVQRLGGLGDWAAVSIRGSTLRQVLVALDGVPLNPDGADSVNLSELPLWAFERVEIFRGNAPPELAASPIGGVVNLRTGSGKRGVGAGISYGSLRTARVTAFANVPGAVGRVPVDGLLLAEAFGTRGDFTYFADNGTEYNLLDDGFAARQNNDKRQLSVHARARVGPRSQRLSLMEAVLARDEGLPGHANNPAATASLTTIRSLTSGSFAWGRGNASGELTGWGLLRDERLDDRAGELGVGAQQTFDRTTSLGATTQARLATPSASPAVTLSARRDQYRSTDVASGVAADPSGRVALTPSVSADLRYRTIVTVSPVLSALILTHDGALAASAGPLAAFTPRAGALVRPVPQLALKANVGRYLRPPDFSELFGDRGAIIGNPGLTPEHGLQWDVGARAIYPPEWTIQGSFELGYFQNAVTDLIVYVQNSQRTMVPLNLEDAWIDGVEGALSVQAPWLESLTNLTRTRSINLSPEPQYANNQLPRIPTWDLFQSTALLAGDRVRVGHTFTYSDGNTWDRTNWYHAAPRAYHSVFVRVQPAARWPSAELEVLNLTDRITEVVPRNPLDPSDDALIMQPITDFVGYPLPGRTVMLTVRWQTEPPK
jgi:iron complex outermembrane receptor protein